MFLILGEISTHNERANAVETDASAVNIKSPNCLCYRDNIDSQMVFQFMLGNKDVCHKL